MKILGEPLDEGENLWAYYPMTPPGLIIGGVKLATKCEGDRLDNVIS